MISSLIRRKKTDMNAMPNVPEHPNLLHNVSIQFEGEQFFVAVCDDAADPATPFVRLPGDYTTIDDVIFAAQHYARENGLAIPYTHDLHQLHADHLDLMQFEAELPW